MVFTKNYYTVLGLGTPRQEKKELTQDALRKAYKTALLSAHPDKATSLPRTQGDHAYTIDDVKEALAVLSDESRRKEYNRWLATRENNKTIGDAGLSTDFVLGFELLDLSDFEASMGYARMESAPGTPDFNDLENLRIAHQQDPGSTLTTDDLSDTQADINGNEDEDDMSDDGVGGMEWTRACRCGAEKGFRILERELEDAEGRGEKEVLVGCEGCSLWVRVGFDVEEG